VSFCGDGTLRDLGRVEDGETREVLREPVNVRSGSDEVGVVGKEVLPGGPAGGTPMRPSGT